MDVEAQEFSGQTSAEVDSDLLDTVHQMFYNQVLNAIRAGANVNIAVDQNYTYLHQAVQSGNERAMRILLAYGANPNCYATDYDNTLNTNDILTPLHSAVKLNSKRMVVLLLIYGAKVNAYTMRGFTALHLAVRFSDLPVIQSILSPRYVDMPIRCNLFAGYTALHMAIDLEKKKAVKILLDANANVALKNQEGWAPLQLIKSKDIFEIVLTHPRFFEKEEELAQCLYINKVNFNEKPKSNPKSLFLMAHEYGFMQFAIHMRNRGAYLENTLDWDMHLLHQTFQSQLKM